MLKHFEEKDHNKEKSLHEKDHHKQKGKHHKAFKIRYHVNLLPSMLQNDGSLMDAIAESDEAEIFRTECVIDLIDFKWDAFANSTQRWGVYTNVLYSVAMIVYVCMTIIPV